MFYAKARPLVGRANSPTPARQWRGRRPSRNWRAAVHSRDRGGPAARPPPLTHLAGLRGGQFPLKLLNIVRSGPGSAQLILFALPHTLALRLLFLIAKCDDLKAEFDRKGRRTTDCHISNTTIVEEAYRGSKRTDRWDYQEFRVWPERLNLFMPLPG